MIERLLIKNQLSFEHCDLEFTSGLIAFSGPSGAGKSVLMQAVLSLFGFGEAQASLVEASLRRDLDLEALGLLSDEPNVFKYTKSKTTRYFVNLQSVSRVNMSQIASTFVNYLSAKESDEFENEKLLSLLDTLIGSVDALHIAKLSEFQELYGDYKADRDALELIKQKEKKIEELKEFARFEIDKIAQIDPKIGEDIQLLAFKKTLSKKEKIEEALSRAEVIFEHEHSVSEVLGLLERESGFFDECMNELRGIFEDQKERFNELEEIDVESLLGRIEQIGTLKNRYGSIEEVLEYKSKKEAELAEYENISFQKDALEHSCEQKLKILEQLCKDLSANRAQYLEVLNTKINSYLEMLYMPEVAVLKHTVPMDTHGWDALEVALGRVNVKKISSGELNRLRLAFVATKSEYLQSGGGILILDEIDANLSGKESMSVAKVLKQLSKKYQIFAISHQPQLSSVADLHFLVTKEDGKSMVRLLDKKDRVVELARMVSGEEVSEEATKFAKTLLE